MCCDKTSPCARLSLLQRARKDTTAPPGQNESKTADYDLPVNLDAVDFLADAVGPDDLQTDRTASGAQAIGEGELRLRKIAPGPAHRPFIDAARACQPDPRADPLYVGRIVLQPDPKPVVAGRLIISKQAGRTSGLGQNHVQVAIAVQIA